MYSANEAQSVRLQLKFSYCNKSVQLHNNNVFSNLKGTAVVPKQKMMHYV